MACPVSISAPRAAAPLQIGDDAARNANPANGNKLRRTTGMPRALPMLANSRPILRTMAITAVC
jgi:hypothetical protein